MEDDTVNWRNPKPCSSQKRNRSSDENSPTPNKRGSIYTRSSGNRNTPQQTDTPRSGLLPLKRVFGRVLSDVTNTPHHTPTEPQSGVFNKTQSVHTQRESSRGKDFRILTHYLIPNSR